MCRIEIVYLPVSHSTFTGLPLFPKGSAELTENECLPSPRFGVV